MAQSLHLRLKIVSGVVLLVSVALLGQLVLFQFRLDPEVEAALQTNAGTTQGREVIIQPNRGNIYDRNGRVLAVNRLEYRVGISPSAVGSREREQVARDLARILELNELDLLALLRPDENGLFPNAYIPLKSFVPLEVGKQLEDLDIPGVVLDPMYLREYPQGDLMAQLIGFVNYVEEQGDAQTVGYWGIEAHYQRELAGQSRVRVETDIPLDVSEEDVQIRDGQDLMLTIDRDLQWITTQMLREFIEEEQANGGSVTGGTIIVMNPETGEILAMVSYPTFSVEDYLEIPDRDKPVFNPAISSVYEPGSIFKIITAAVALDIQKPGFDLNWSYYNQGCEEMGGVRICDATPRVRGTTTFAQCLISSLNTCTSHWNQEIGHANWYEYLERFGFGRTTEVDLDGEVSGIVNWKWSPLWSEANFLQTSFGQGISVTPLQMLTAANAIANDGIIMQPHIVRARIDGDQIYEVVPTRVGRPITAQSAQQVLALMVQAVENEEGFSGRARVEGYSVAGKTGTAQKLGPDGRYSDDDSWASFIGFVPADDPKLTVLVVLDNPEEYWGSLTSAPLFAKLVSRLVVVMLMPPDNIRNELINSGGRPFDRD